MLSMSDAHSDVPQHLNVIIVDDDESAFELCRLQLGANKETAYSLSWASSVGDAVQAFDGQHFDVALVDYRIGINSGLDLIDRIHQHGFDTPCILLTGDEAADQLERNALHRGAADFLSKDSVTPEVLDRTIRHAHERHQAAHELLAEKHRLEQTLSSITEAVITVDDQYRITYMNAIAEKMSGFSSRHIMGQSLFDCIDFKFEGTEESYNDEIKASLATRNSYNVVTTQNNYLLVSNQMGDDYNVECSISPILSVENDSGYICIIKDVTEAREWARQLIFQDSHDKLTGLLNRTAFENQLQQSIDRAAVSHADTVFCYFDIDQFKVVNDSCGHAAGDELLRQVSEIFSQNVRCNDICARLGGDEFGLILRDCGINDGRRIAEKILEDMTAYRFQWAERTYTVRASSSVVLIDAESENWASLLADAHAACEYGKDNGGQRVIVASDVSSAIAERKGEMQWVAEIIDAIEENRLLLFSQPIVPIVGSDSGAHHEILVRLRDTNGNVVPPGVFLPAAEHYHVMSLIDRWVIEHTLAWYAAHPDALEELGMCSVNLSGESIDGDGVVDFIRDCFQSTGVPPNKFCFEITETVAITDLRKASVLINSLREMGCYFALDDFGAGMSSFAYLKNLRVDFVKIDGSFVRDLHEDPVNCALVKSINEVGHIMGKKTIAEFVENSEITAVLKVIGVDYAQGYHFGKPEPL